MISSKIIVALILSSAALATPIPARVRSGPPHRHSSSSNTHRTSHRTSNSHNSHRTSRTSQSIHDDHQHHLQGLNAAAQQQVFQQGGQQHQAQQQHHVHVVNAAHNQAWAPPAHQNPVNLQPLTVANPRRTKKKKKGGCTGLCTVMKRGVMELEARDLEELEVRELDELD